MKITKEDIVKLIQEELDSLQEFDVERRKMRDIPIQKRSEVMSMFLRSVIDKATDIVGDKMNIEDDKRKALREEMQGLLFGIMDRGTSIVSVEMAERIAGIYLGKKEIGSLK